MSELVSIIIPVYNTEQYIEKCIESVLNQTYSDYELICIDDGSTDGTSAILDKYAEQYGCIRVIHQKNAGISAARNVGLDICRGEYIVFLDSDDFMHPRMLEILYHELKENACQMSLCQIKNVENRETVMGDVPVYQTKKYSGLELIDWYYGTDPMRKQEAVIVYLKMYQKDLFQNIRFPVGQVYEDNCIFHWIATSVDSFVEVPVALYYRYLRSDSIMGTTKAIFTLRNFQILYPMRERCVYFLEKHCDKYANQAFKEYLHTIRILFFQAKKAKQDEQEVCTKLIREYKDFLKKVKQNRVYTVKELLKAYCVYLYIYIYGGIL